MRKFTVPFTTDFEDKIIGGKLSLRQAGWLSIPVLHTLRFLYKALDKGYISILGVIINIVIIIGLAIITGLFAFYKKNGITYDKYILKRIKFKIRKRSYKFYE